MRRPKQVTIRAGEVAGRDVAVRLSRNGWAVRALAGFEVRGRGRSGDLARVRGFVAVGEIRTVLPDDRHPWQSREELAAWGREQCEKFAAVTPPESSDWTPTHAR